MALATRLFVHHGSHRTLANSARSWAHRSGALLEVTDGSLSGYGEATPLPGHGVETFEETVQAMESLTLADDAGAPPFSTLSSTTGEPSAPAALVDWLDSCVRMTPPSARFALETALLDYWARRLGVPLWRLLTSSPVSERLFTSSVVDPFTATFDDVAQLLRSGTSTVKLKVGRDLEHELAFVKGVRERFAPAELRLRLDANRAWPREDALDFAARFEPYAIELIEEPSASPWPERPPHAVPWAADESLTATSPRAPWPPAAPEILVLKPMLLGGFSQCLLWAARGRLGGGRVVVSHLFDGPLALAAATQLAFAVQSRELAAGLGLHAGLEAWSSVAPEPSFVSSRGLSLPRAAGLGVSPWGVPRASSRARTLASPASLLSPLAAARERPDHPAFVTKESTHTFEELGRAVELEAAELEARGAASASRTSGRPIAFVARTSWKTFVRLHACIELGVPVLPLHPRSSAAETERVIERVRPAFVLTDDEDSHSPSPTPTESLPPVTGLHEDLAWLMTSGSTRAPKAVRLSRRSFLASAAASAENLSWLPEDRWLLSLPLAHVGGLSVLTRCLLARRTVVVDRKLVPREWLAFLDETRVTLLSLVPTQLVRLLDDPDFALPPRVRAVLLGGAPATPRLLERARARSVPVLPTYGLTETCSQVATERLTLRANARPKGENTEPGLVGPALRDVEVRIDASGAIAVRGPQLFSGYADEPSPFDADGFFETRDLGALDAHGTLHVFGRRDSVILTGGENVAAEAVEADLAEHPAIRALCVVGVPHEEWGELVTAVVDLGAHASDDTLRDIERWARARLTGFRCPKRWLLRADLPLLPSGKLNRRAIAAWAARELGVI